MKKVDEKKIKAFYLFHCPNEDTFGKQIESCTRAGYGAEYSRKHSPNILALDSFKDIVRHKFKNLGLIAIDAAINFATKHKDNPEAKHIREIHKFFRDYGESEGWFVKRVETKSHNIEEKREIKVFATLNEERKYWLELNAMGSQRIKAIDVEVVKSG